jgi:predicted MFS family arabinose efflux permease
VALLPAIAAVALCGLLYALFGRDDPSELGLPRYGEDTPAQPPAKPSGSAVALSLRSLSLAGRQPVFWILFASFFICGLSTIGLMATHFVPFCADAGVATVTAAGMLAAMGICDFFGTIGSGWLSDRFDSRWLLTWYYSLRGFSLVWLAYSDFSLLGLSVFAVFFGLDYIATIPPTVRLTVQAFGRDRGPVVFGWIFAGHQLGAATMAAAAGASRDALATYLPAFVSGGFASVAAGALTLLLIGARNPARPQPA